MFPVEFDRAVLASLPLTDEDDVNRVTKILEAIVSRRVIPYFRRSRGTDPILLRSVNEKLSIVRLEDDLTQIQSVTLITRHDGKWTLHIHERVFDYLAFVIPSQPESRLGKGTPDERKMLAFSEFMLRHEIEHMLYPTRDERETLQSDVAFAMERREEDPTYYHDLCSALEDEMTGLKGEHYMDLFERAEKGEPVGTVITRMLNHYILAIVDTPEILMRQVFPFLCTELKTKLLGVFYRRSRETSYPLLRRTYFFQKMLRLFLLLADTDEPETERVFRAFKERWGVIFLFHELDLPEASLEDRDTKEILKVFKENVTRFLEETCAPFELIQPRPPLADKKPKTEEPKTMTLKDRIEQVRHDSTFPPQVLQVIEKNKLNAVGHSGYKYSELIETLLAINWGSIQPIEVTPQEFEEGLDRTHYGLKKPKELICDFFSNLIWRYQELKEKGPTSWRGNGSSYLFVGPPGVGKTSLAISIAENLRIPYHKLSLGGMHDEADLRGHGFTYEGSKPGAIVQGIIKMGVMNGMFIMDEADKTEKAAVATLLEILDPEQNHLFHDKYTQTTVDIDLSNSHFILTANTLETVPPPVINRCEVVMLDRYSVDEKIAIAQQHLITRVRNRYHIAESMVYFDQEDEARLLRYLIKTYTHEPGVRELERIIRTLFLRIFRKEILSNRNASVHITREKIREHLDPPRPPRQINDEDRVGEMTALGVNLEHGVGSIIPIQATPILFGGGDHPLSSFLSMVHATGNIEKIMDESRKVATTAILHCGRELGVDLKKSDTAIHLHFMGGSTPKDGPSAGGAIALALASILSGRRIRRDVAMTGEIDTHGRITSVGALALKLETAYDAGCKTVIVPEENLFGEEGIERLPDALKRELQILTYEQWSGDHEPFNHDCHVLEIVAVDSILEAADVAFIDQDEIDAFEGSILSHARQVAARLASIDSAHTKALRAIYVKHPWELSVNGFADSFWEKNDCVFLVKPELRKGLAERWPVLGAANRLWDFDPKRQNVASVLKNIAVSRNVNQNSAIPSSFLAPFFFLKRDRTTLEALEAEPRLDNLVLFANNYVAQGFKVKLCKQVVSRVYQYLSLLPPKELDQCCFLANHNGFYVLDVGMLQEKYRLDARRVETMLTQALKKWLLTVESS